MFTFCPRPARLCAAGVAGVAALWAEPGLMRSRAESPDEPPPARSTLRVCADPNNMPFSNDKLEGFENKIAALVAREMGADVEYVWRAQRRGFFRVAFKEKDCDLAPGAPAGMEGCLTTIPYYRSRYVLISRADRRLGIESLEDPRLADLRIGVQLAAESATPPAKLLGRRGLADNLVGYSLFQDHSMRDPTTVIVDAVIRGEIDAAVAWGPLAGYCAARRAEEAGAPAAPLTLVPVKDSGDPDLPMSFDICVAVRRGRPELRDRINEILTDKKAEIDAILDAFGVPRSEPERADPDSIPETETATTTEAERVEASR